MTAPDRPSGQATVADLIELATDAAHAFRALAAELDRALDLTHGRGSSSPLDLELILVHARERARDLDPIRDLVLVLHRDLSRDLSRAWARALDRDRARPEALVLALDRALDRADGLARRHASAAARARALDRDLARVLARGLDRDRARPEALVRALDRALDRADGLARRHASAAARARAWALGRDLDLGLALDLDRALDDARDLAFALDRELTCVATEARVADVLLNRRAPTDPAAAHVGVSSRPSRRAVQLSTVAVRLLPLAERARFREEFHAELHDLAAAGTGRWAQLSHALRLLTRAGAHRHALRARHPGRERAR